MFFEGGRQRTVSKNGHIKCARERDKVMRGLEDEPTAQTITDGFRIYYNFIRPLMALNGKTPAQASGIDVKNDWHVLVENSKKKPN